MNSEICLIGNPNCGKTTLFNLLTGSYQKVGNWTGVTVEKKYGYYKKNNNIKIVDLPGLYSLMPYSGEEKVVTEYLKDTKNKCVINILDGTNLERNLYLTLELASLNIPVVIAVNFYDDLEKNNVKLDIDFLSKLFGIPVVNVSALKNTNVDKLMNLAIENTKKIQIESIIKKENPKIFIERNLNKIISNTKIKSKIITEKIDKVVTNKIFALPILFVVLATIYFLTMKVGGFLGKYIQDFFDGFSAWTKFTLLKVNAPTWLISLLCGAVISGLGTVIAFLPQILVLFFLLTIVEESGYASRIAFITDYLFREFGLSGKSVITFMVSCGCMATGLMSAKTIEKKQERNMTIFLSPFIPCGAKTVVFGWFSGVIFGGNPFIATIMYFISIIAICIFSKILLRLKIFKFNNGTFILEMPTYRLPSVKDVFYVLREKTKDFLVKAGSVIFCVSVLLWFLNSFGVHGFTDNNVEKSFLYLIGNGLKFIFLPLGFGSWQASVSVLSGIMAKEAVIESLTFLSSSPQTLFENGFSAFAFMTFVLLSPPCMASLITAKNQLKDNKLFTKMIFLEFIFAYLFALIINLLGKLYYELNGLIFILLTVIILLIVFIKLLKISLTPCKGCGKCKNKGEKVCVKN